MEELNPMYAVIEVPCDAHGTRQVEVHVDLESGGGVSDTPDGSIYWERQADGLWHPQEGAPPGWGPGRIVRFEI